MRLPSLRMLLVILGVLVAIYTGGMIIWSVEFLSLGGEEVRSDGIIQPMVGKLPPSSQVVVAGPFGIGGMVGVIVFRLRMHSGWRWAVAPLAGFGTFTGVLVLGFLVIVYVTGLYLERTGVAW